MNTEQFDGHTPGPWEHGVGCDPDTDTDGQYIWQKEGPDRHGEVVWGHNYACREADIELMAAAPDLLAKVKRLRDLVDFAIAVIDSNHCYMGEWEQADLLNYLREMVE